MPVTNLARSKQTNVTTLRRQRPIYLGFLVQVPRNLPEGVRVKSLPRYQIDIHCSLTEDRGSTQLRTRCTFACRRAVPMIAPVRKVAAALTALLALTSAAVGETSSTSISARRLRSTNAPVPRIVNGARAGGFYPTVGMLARNGFFQCSGTLIGCHTFLTAGHCVSPPFVPAQYSVFLQHLGFVGVASIARNPDFAFGVRSDEAILTLSTTVSGFSPSSINTVAEPPLGTIGDIVGFGSVGELFGPGTSDFYVGIKRRGDVVTSACTEVPESSNICWDFTAPLGPPGTDSNTCIGDSGGPLFADVAGLGTAVAGVTSGGNATCLPDDSAFDADVHFDHAWIESVSGTDLGPITCSPIPPVLGPGSEVLYDQFGMEDTESGVVYDLVVPAGASALRVTTNGELVPSQNYDLYVKLGGAPSVEPPDYDCASTRGNSFESCSFDAPAAGEWSILVANPGASEGEYDVTVSILGAPAPGPCSPLDVDGDGALLPLSDGVLVVRYLFGLTGDALTSGALGPGATRDATAIVALLDGCGGVLDVDGDGAAGPLSDGLLFLRYWFGFRDEVLMIGAVTDGCSRCEAAAIEAYLATLTG